MKPHKAKIGKRFERLRPILDSWSAVLKEYCERTEKDSPFWYRERTQIGFLAMAAWIEGWAVLEEWGTKKKNESNGRNDLWFGKGKDQWFVEAKHIWCEIQKGQNSILKKLKKARKSAKNSARKLNCESCYTKVAAVFVSPTWKGKSEADFTTAKNQWINICENKIKASAVALVFSEFDDRRHKGQHGEHFAGSALLLFKL